MVYYRRRRGGYRRRRPSYRRRFKRGPGYRRGYRRFRRRGAYPPKRGSFTGWPEINYVTHLWHSTYRVAPVAGTQGINWGVSIRANGVYDPWASPDMHATPSRFASMSALYERHTVLGSKIRVTISGPTGCTATSSAPLRTDQTEYVACLRTNDTDSTVSLERIDEYMAAPDRKNHYKRCQLAPMLAPVTAGTTVAGGDVGQTRVTMRGTWSLKRDCGGTDTTSNVWTAEGNTDPEEERYYSFGLAYADGNNQNHKCGYLVEVSVSYFVKWESLKDLSYTGA